MNIAEIEEGLRALVGAFRSGCLSVSIFGGLRVAPHWLFAQARLDIEIKARSGKPYRPREWFLLPLPIIEQAISMIIDGSVVRFRYDHPSGEVRPS